MSFTSAPNSNLLWPDDGTSRIPYWAYTRDDIYQRELRKFSTANTGATWRWKRRSRNRAILSAAWWVNAR